MGTQSSSSLSGQLYSHAGIIIMEYSSDHLSPISPVLYTSISPAGTADSSFAGTPIKHEEGSFAEPPRKKQKRNKPTLSCEECVERKTKVSRAINTIICQFREWD